MKKISLRYLVASFCFIANFAFGQEERNIILMHGLGGTAKAWVKYDEYFNATRKANPIRFSYTEDSGILGAMNDARTQMAAAVPASSYSQNIVIAHSQGGIVTRSIAKEFAPSQRPFGGFITVGTPNLGAKVITSYKTGKISAFTQDATQQLLAGPSASFLNLLPSWIPNVLNSQIPGLVEKIIVEQSGIDHSTTNDFYPGAPYLTALNNYNPNIPRVGIVSYENSPCSHWKTLTSYSLNSVTDLPLNQEDDDDLEQYMASGQTFYTGIMLYYRLRATLAILPHKHMEYLRKASLWENGVKWFTNSEGKYAELIGNLETVLVNIPQSSCAWPCSTLDCTMGYSGCSWQSTGGYSFYQTNLAPTDGIVPLAAQYLPGAIENFVLEGPNHAEQRNHPKITETLDGILDGTIGKAENKFALSYFKIPKL